MALDKSPDMEGMTPAERAALYKQRAAALGIGKAPNTSGATAAPAKPAAPSPVAAPALPSTAVAERPGPAVPAKVAAAAAARREQVAAVAAREAAPSHKEQSERLVYVWPHLVTIEFMSAMLLLFSLVLVSVVLQAPLIGHANLDKTPNPSKAPWYFLNLQELLLHMHPALAGVIVPSVVLFGLIPAIPYIDRNTADVGKWFGTPKAVRISVFTFIYSTFVLIAEILFDELIGVKPLLKSIADATGQPWLVDPNPLGIGLLSMTNVIVPLTLMIAPIFLLLWLLKLIYKPDTIRDYMFALFTGFVAAFIVLTISGTFFRGQGMRLMWPWDPRQERVE
ncbi:MAG: menaquinol-cytochrome C reductase [Chloroflexi bacterium]|nr:menaquinol-cytochrome C reductase [Chloroflexota bacterium]